ncbi:MAG: PAAR domain-containing protein [Deltaproteobacteria bacterium]|nr:PAAR domain-containing protein [Deltaproteobacteria bacterium]
MPRPAARLADPHTCPLVAPSGAPHVGGPIMPPCAPTVFIEGKPVARVTDHAFCVGVPPDTIRGGLISVFVEGNPPSRMGDMTDVGSITAGSATVFLGEWAGGALTAEQAQWLYNYMASQQDIPFEYANNGCFTRADRMAEHINSLGIPVEKFWVRATTASGALDVPIANYPGGGVMWDWHVAPIVQVASPSGPVGMVIDPSLSLGRPVTTTEWISAQNPNPASTVSGTTSRDVYTRGWDYSSETWDASGDHMRDPATTSAHLDHFRDLRAALPASSGRNIANAPVHF